MRGVRGAWVADNANGLTLLQDEAIAPHALARSDSSVQPPSCTSKERTSHDMAVGHHHRPDLARTTRQLWRSPQHQEELRRGGEKAAKSITFPTPAMSVRGRQGAILALVQALALQPECTPCQSRVDAEAGIATSCCAKTEKNLILHLQEHSS